MAALVAVDAVVGARVLDVLQCPVDDIDSGLSVVTPGIPSVVTPGIRPAVLRARAQRENQHAGADE
jgi:hypothetical protein